MTPDVPTPPQAVTPTQVKDHRPRPTGGLPPAMQTWAMLGLAAIIVVIVLATQGTPSRTPPTRATAPTAQPPSQSVAADFRARLEAEARQLDEARRQLAAQQAPFEEEAPADTAPAAATPDPYAAVRQEQIRRDYESLFSDHVAYGSARPSRDRTGPNARDEGGLTLDAALRAALSATTPAVGPAPTPEADRTPAVPTRGPSGQFTSPLRPGGAWHRLLEGTILEAALTTRLDGEFAGPVQALVTTPVYALDSRALLIPAGARLLGQARAVTVSDQRRLAVSFHRLVWPDGRALTLEGTPPALNQIGETGLRDVVHHHYASVFGAAIAIAAITGLANTGFGLGGDAVVLRGGAGLDQAATRVLDRYLNRLPSITIREGHRLRVLLTADVDLPVYRAGAWLDTPDAQPNSPLSTEPRAAGGRP